jgi:MFS transporter, DHA1 family, inner membrane transport protein
VKQRLSFQILVFIVIKALLNTMVRMVYPYQSYWIAGLGVDTRAFSRAISLRYAMSIFAPFLAASADRRGRRFGMLFGLALFVLGTALVAVYPSFPTFVAALVLALLGNLVFIPSLQAYLGDRVPYQRRGRALALTELGWSLSFIIGVPLIGWLIARRGWLAPFPVLAILGVLAMLALLIMLPRDEPAAEGQPPAWHNLRRVFTYAPALAGLLVGASISGSNEVINLVFERWMVDVFEVKILTMGITAAVIGFSDLSGELLVVGFTDKLGKTRAVTLGLLLNILAVLALPLLGRSLPGAIAGLALVYLTFEFTMVSAIPLMTEVMPGLRATFMAGFFASTTLGRAFGALLAPGLYEFGKDSGFLSGILVIVCAAALGNLIGLAATRYIHRTLALH